MAEAVLVGERAAPSKAFELVATPDQKTIEDVSAFLKSDPAQSVKALLVQGVAEEGEAVPVVALFLRGDHELNEIKAEKHPLIASPLTFATEEQLAQYGLTAGFVVHKVWLKKALLSL